MSFEGYYQCLCDHGHYWTEDCYTIFSGDDSKSICPECKNPHIWKNLVDITNGSFEEDEEKRIDGYIELELESEKICKECGSILEQRFKIPK